VPRPGRRRYVSAPSFTQSNVEGGSVRKRTAAHLEAASSGNMYPGQDWQRDERARLQRRRQHHVVSGRRLFACVGWLLDSCRRMELAACMTTMPFSGCARSAGGGDAQGCITLIFQPKYWKASRNLTRPPALHSPRTGHNAAHSRVLR
jgi:hypothetical protein